MAVEDSSFISDTTILIIFVALALIALFGNYSPIYIYTSRIYGMGKL